MMPQLENEKAKALLSTLKGRLAKHESAKATSAAQQGSVAIEVYPVTDPGNAVKISYGARVNQDALYLPNHARELALEYMVQGAGVRMRSLETKRTADITDTLVNPSLVLPVFDACVVDPGRDSFASIGVALTRFSPKAKGPCVFQPTGVETSAVPTQDAFMLAIGTCGVPGDSGSKVFDSEGRTMAFYIGQRDGVGACTSVQVFEEYFARPFPFSKFDFHAKGKMKIKGRAFCGFRGMTSKKWRTLSQSEREKYWEEKATIARYLDDPNEDAIGYMVESGSHPEVLVMRSDMSFARKYLTREQFEQLQDFDPEIWDDDEEDQYVDEDGNYVMTKADMQASKMLGMRFGDFEFHADADGLKATFRKESSSTLSQADVISDAPRSRGVSFEDDIPEEELLPVTEAERLVDPGELANKADSLLDELDRMAELTVYSSIPPAVSQKEKPEEKPSPQRKTSVFATERKSTRKLWSPKKTEDTRVDKIEQPPLSQKEALEQAKQQLGAEADLREIFALARELRKAAAVQAAHPKETSPQPLTRWQAIHVAQIMCEENQVSEDELYEIMEDLVETLLNANKDPVRLSAIRSDPAFKEVFASQPARKAAAKTGSVGDAASMTSESSKQPQSEEEDVDPEEALLQAARVEAELAAEKAREAKKKQKALREQQKKTLEKALASGDPQEIERARSAILRNNAARKLKAEAKELNKKIAEEQKAHADAQRNLSKRKMDEAREELLAKQEAEIEELVTYLKTQPIAFVVPAPHPLTPQELANTPALQHQQLINKNYIKRLTQLKQAKQARLKRQSDVAKARLREEEEQAAAKKELLKLREKIAELQEKLKDQGDLTTSESEN